MTNDGAYSGDSNDDDDNKQSQTNDYDFDCNDQHICYYNDNGVGNSSQTQQIKNTIIKKHDVGENKHNDNNDNNDKDINHIDHKNANITTRLYPNNICTI